MSDKVLISVLVPTRHQREPDGLVKALESIKSSARCFAQVQILLRIDDDDMRRLGQFPDLCADYNAVAVVGPRFTGYTSMGLFINELVPLATGRWCWLFDDDSWVEGDWQGPLEKMPPDCAVNTQYYRLGDSNYENGPDGGCVGLIVPRDLIKDLHHQNPVDQQWLSIVKQKGWTVRQMIDTTYFHEGRAR